MTCTFYDLIEAGEVPWLVRQDRAAAFPLLPGGEPAPGHTLVISATHSLGVIDTSPADLAAAMALVQRLGRISVSDGVSLRPFVPGRALPHHPDRAVYKVGDIELVMPHTEPARRPGPDRG